MNLYPRVCLKRGSPGSYLCVEATSCLQKQRQVGLHLAAVGVGSVLRLALERRDLVFKSMIPPEENTVHEDLIE